jgi:hypothetical protein
VPVETHARCRVAVRPVNRRLTMTLHSVATLRPAVREDVGDLETRQAIDEDARDSLDPFLLLAHHGPQVYPPADHGLPFGPHSHRGFETVTFIRSGALAHHETGGHRSVIEAGGVRSMTVGSGLIHAELSPSAEGICLSARHHNLSLAAKLWSPIHALFERGAASHLQHRKPPLRPIRPQHRSLAPSFVFGHRRDDFEGPQKDASRSLAITNAAIAALLVAC